MKKKKILTWSEERNFNKMRIAGMLAVLSLMMPMKSTTRTEAAWINDTIRSLTNVYNAWNKNNVASKKKFGEG